MTTKWHMLKNSTDSIEKKNECHLIMLVLYYKSCSQFYQVCLPVTMWSVTSTTYNRMCLYDTFAFPIEQEVIKISDLDNVIFISSKRIGPNSRTAVSNAVPRRRP